MHRADVAAGRIVRRDAQLITARRQIDPVEHPQAGLLDARSSSPA